MKMLPLNLASARERVDDLPYKRDGRILKDW
jgi:hypothetical protein